MVLMLLVYTTSFSQNYKSNYESDFYKLSSLFEEIEFPFSSKDAKSSMLRKTTPKIDSISSTNILMLGKDDLYYEDLVWDLDSEKEGATKVSLEESYPRPLYKISNKSYTAYLIFLERNHEMSGDNEYWSKMYTFNNSGVFLDSVTVSCYDFSHLRKVDMTFLSNNVFRTFNYKDNKESYVIRKNIFGNEEQVYFDDEPKSVCEITEYKITNDGKITKTGWHDVVPLNDYLQMYFRQEIRDDDPIKEYVK